MYRRILIATVSGCLAALALTSPAIAQTLTVNKTIAKGGVVTSDPDGIDCGTSCSSDSGAFPGEQFCDPDLKPPCRTLPQGVTLTDAPASGFKVSWSGDCDSTGGDTCNIVMNADKTVTAHYQDVMNPSATLTRPTAGNKRGTIEFGASASDNWGVHRVEFYVGAQLVAADTTAPYSAMVNTAVQPGGAPRPDGQYPVRADAIDLGGRRTASVPTTIVIDNTAPTVSVTGPDGRTFAPGSTQTWTIGADGGASGLSSVECSVVVKGTPASFGPCSGDTGSHSVSDRPAGTHTLAVRAEDGAGNESAVVTREFTIDATPPATRILGGPVAGSSSTATSATFTFGSSEPSTYRCRVYPAALTPPAFGACSGATSHTAGGFSPGTYSFEVVATDAVGNVDPSPVKRTFTVVAPPPAPGGGSAGGGSAGGGTEPPPSSIAATLSYRFKASRRFTRFTKLTVRGLTEGMMVQVRCRGKRCPAKRWKATAKGGKLALRKHRKRKLRAGVRLEIRITAPGMVGKVIRIKVRKRKAPTSKTLCLAPGARKPSACG